MRTIFRPQSINKTFTIRNRLRGYRLANPAFAARADGHPRHLTRVFRRLHYAAHAAPEPIRKKWKVVEQRFIARLVPMKASTSYVNSWSAEKWL